MSESQYCQECAAFHTENEPCVPVDITPTKTDYVSVGMTEDKQQVRLTFENADGEKTVVNIEQLAALTLAGQIQYHAMTIRKP